MVCVCEPKMRSGLRACSHDFVSAGLTFPSLHSFQREVWRIRRRGTEDKDKRTRGQEDEGRPQILLGASPPWDEDKNWRRTIVQESLSNKNILQNNLLCFSYMFDLMYIKQKRYLKKEQNSNIMGIKSQD